MSALDGLVEFLTARLDEREEAARAASPGPWWWDEKFGTDQDNGLALTNAAGSEIVGAYNTHCCEFRDDPNVSDADRAFIAANDPAFALADIAAKRRLIDLHTPHEWKPESGLCQTCGSGEEYEYPTEWPCETIRLLALPFSGHRDYRQEWQPS